MGNPALVGPWCSVSYNSTWLLCLVFQSRAPTSGHTAERDSWSEHLCGGPVSALAPLRPPHFSCSVMSSGRSHCKSFWDKVERKGREGQPAGLVLAAPFLRASPPTRKGPDGRMQGEIWHPPLLSQECSPSVLILRAVRTRANRVALNMTVPSLLRGMFMATSLCKQKTFLNRRRMMDDSHVPFRC